MVLSVLVLTLLLTIILLSRHFTKNAGIVYLIYILVLFSLRQMQFYTYQSFQYPELLTENGYILITETGITILAG